MWRGGDRVYDDVLSLHLLSRGGGSSGGCLMSSLDRWKLSIVIYLSIGFERILGCGCLRSSLGKNFREVCWEEEGGGGGLLVLWDSVWMVNEVEALGWMGSRR